MAHAYGDSRFGLARMAAADIAQQQDVVAVDSYRRIDGNRPGRDEQQSIS